MPSWTGADEGRLRSPAWGVREVLARLHIERPKGGECAHHGADDELVPCVLEWDAGGMRSYGQYCPIARASELLAERWTIIVLRNIVILGCRTFNEIADGAPGLSRGLLSKRLRELERAGVIQIRPKPDAPGSIYEPTEAGRELTQLMRALQDWGSKWADLTPEQAHPGVVLWMWATFFLDRERLPQRRVLIRFDYPTLSGPGSRSWLLIERGDAEICEKYPGGEEHLVVVVHDPVAFARWHMGEIGWADALRSGAVELLGPRNLARALPTWHRDHARGPRPLHGADPAPAASAPAPALARA